MQRAADIWRYRTQFDAAWNNSAGYVREIYGGCMTMTALGHSHPVACVTPDHDRSWAFTPRCLHPTNKLAG